MRKRAYELFSAGSDLSDLFDLKDDGYRGAVHLRDFELREEELYWWRMPHSARVGRALESGQVRGVGPAPLSNPLELFRIIGSHALASRSLVYPMRAPAYWVRHALLEESETHFRPALPECQLADLFEAPVRQIQSAFQPLLEDRAIELVRSPSGVRAVLAQDGFFDESRFKTRLRA